MKYYLRDQILIQIQKHPKDPRHRILLAELYFRKFLNIPMAIYHLIQAEYCAFLNPYSKFMIFRLRHELTEYQEQYNQDYFKNKSLENVLMVESIFKSAKSQMKKLAELNYKFWSVWGRSEYFEVKELVLKMNEIYHLKQACQRKWNSIKRFIRFNKNYQAFYYLFYKYYIQKKLSLSEDEIQNVMGPPERFRIRPATLLKSYNFDNFMYNDNSGVVHISMSMNQIGTILGVNGGIERMFRFTKQFLIGKNISILMPEPINKYHDMVMDNFFKEYRTFNNGFQINSYGRTGDGFLLNIAIFYKKITNFRGEFELIGLIREVQSKNDKQVDMIADTFGNVFAATENMNLEEEKDKMLREKAFMREFENETEFGDYHALS